MARRGPVRTRRCQVYARTAAIDALVARWYPEKPCTAPRNPRD